MAINTKQEGDCGYVAFVGSNRIELYAKSLYAAKELVIKHFKVPKTRQGLVSVTPAERPDGSTVTHTPSF